MRCCSRRVGVSDAAEMSLAENDDVIIARARHVENSASLEVERGDRGRTPQGRCPPYRALKERKDGWMRFLTGTVFDK
jgi:hypothetical protein